MDRVKTGVAGLDELIEGGFPKGSVVLISGSPGTGKTIFGLQFLVEGPKNNEKSLYISFEENRQSILDQANQFGWDLEKLEKEGNFKILCFNMPKTNVINVNAEMDKIAKSFKPIRVVIDSLSVLLVYLEVNSRLDLASNIGMKMDSASTLVSEEAATRASVLNTIGNIRSWGCTSLLTAEMPENAAYLSRDTISSFVCDGVLKVSWLEALNKRTIAVKKMRSTNNNLEAKPFSITKEGVVVEKE
ncbi:MAG: ATPase domain-containing protein [Candidatus Micrarchaeota archaeon]